MARELTTLVTGGRFYEGPRWHDGQWWVSDFYRRAVYTVTPEGVETHQFDVEEQPSGMGWLPDGSLVVVSMKDRHLLRRGPDGVVEHYADLSAVAGGHLNDMVVDDRGRVYVGNFGFDLMGGDGMATASLARVDPDGTVTVVAEGLNFPNGSVITPDGTTLVVAETTGAGFVAFTIADDGSLVDRRVWGSMGEVPETTDVMEALGAGLPAPDGCTLDAEGHIWFADAIGARVARVAPGGEIAESVPMPEGLGAFACQLGGSDGRTLLICAAPDFFEHNRANAEEAVLLTMRVDVPHAGRP
ncbi:SMP-30/gluconolactonase/LRE family protein [Aeromicrobium fastidiosum]|uniref:SMP-30/gluconolactonase/LRE family protein n=1 Tax=Aeromicrobium fastidiosum TaxID=52699 RepID=A0A641AK40_9ACTN|nr:SMP-30/gluconolactonase/LRE family protein [Aeromicrobium fastidiosum]KAA1376050.1 SMP-30/gluconolactonase/LRE family protein [Aeromicrobium fastidiosum]MBP2392079.1 sugar lactone lactonase YvrE [Aeromicrobium fastidiosum]